MCAQMDVIKLEEIGKRIAAEREATALKREEEHQYWLFMRRQRQESNAPYVLPVLLVLVLCILLAMHFGSLSSRRNTATQNKILQVITVVCCFASFACFVALGVLTDVQF